ELRRLDSLRLAFDAQDVEGMSLDAPQHRLGVLFPDESVARELENDLAVSGQQLPERLGLEAADLVVAADDHGQHRRLDPADAPEQAAGAVADGVVSGRVQTDDPVGLVAAPGRRVQRVVVGQRPEAAESRADRLASQRIEPEPPRRFARAAGQLNDVAEDQLALTAGIGGGDQLIGGAEQATDDRQLLAGPLLVEGLEPEPLGHERQGLQRPLLQGRVVILWLLEGDQVAQGPGDLVAPALVVTVMPLRGAEEGRQLTGDRRLLGEHDLHATLASAISPTPLQHRSASAAWERARDPEEATTIHPRRKLRAPAKPIGPYLYYIYYSTYKLRAREERRERLRAELPWKACPGKSPRTGSANSRTMQTPRSTLSASFRLEWDALIPRAQILGTGSDPRIAGKAALRRAPKDPGEARSRWGGFTGWLSMAMSITGNWTTVTESK